MHEDTVNTILYRYIIGKSGGAHDTLYTKVRKNLLHKRQLRSIQLDSHVGSAACKAGSQANSLVVLSFPRRETPDIPER
jgi:hypothetical protein